jgi:hypothetical protein
MNWLLAHALRPFVMVVLLVGARYLSVAVLKCIPEGRLKRLLVTRIS